MSVSDKIITWNELVRVINTRELDQLYRNHEITAKYRNFKAEVAARGESIVTYIIKNRLKWIHPHSGELDLEPSSPHLFTNPSDILIITNDFPYNFENNIAHLVVWTKLPIESDPKSEIGDVPEHTRVVIDRYVKKNFVETLQIDQSDVVWFRNYPAIQSVRELSHVHILVRGADTKDLSRIVNTPGITLDVEEYLQILEQYRS